MNMQWHNFIFSNEPPYRKQRHLACWLLWWIYIVFTIFITKKPGTSGNVFSHHQAGADELGVLQYSLLVNIKSFLLLFIHLFLFYSFIYFLLPKYLLKKRYWSFIAVVLFLCAIIVPMGYFLYSDVYPVVDSLFGLYSGPSNKTILWESIDAGMVNAIKVTLIASAITLMKRWWLKQKEKEQLESEKINAQLQLLKAQIHPDFLLNTLNNIIILARESSSKAPEMIIKLSDLLSYMLYECDVPKVKLEKEINMIKEYMALEKIRQGEGLEMTLRIKGNLNGQLISPLLLLPFIEISFSYCKKELPEMNWVNLELIIENNILSMKLINGISAEGHIDTRNDNQPFANVRRRLELLYPERHELKINAEQELLMVHLILKLEMATEELESTVISTKTFLSYARI